jgi:hypothetical protein
MTDAPTPPPYEGNSTAPFAYFDLVPTQGIMNGAIQIELASRILVSADATVVIKFMTTGRLRCSPTAARYLRDAIDACLKMLDLPKRFSQPHRA